MTIKHTLQTAITIFLLLSYSCNSKKQNIKVKDNVVEKNQTIILQNDTFLTGVSTNYIYFSESIENNKRSIKSKIANKIILEKETSKIIIPKKDISKQPQQIKTYNKNIYVVGASNALPKPTLQNPTPEKLNIKIPMPVKALPPQLNTNNTINYASYFIEQGMYHDAINTMFIDSKKNMWIGYYFGGFSKFDGVYFNNFGKKEGFNNEYQINIKKIIEDKEGNIWLGTNGGGLIKYDGQDFYVYKKENGLKSNYIFNLYIDDENILWITTNYGLSRFDIKKNVLQSYFLNIRNQENINSIAIDKAGVIWLGAGGSGLYKFFNDTLTQYYSDNLFIKNSIRSLVLDKDENAWIGTTNGLYKFYKNTFYKYDISNGLSGSYILSLYIDNSNNICAGTKYAGLNIIKNENSIVQFKSNNDIDNYYINSICQYDDGTYIIGGNGLHLFNNLLTNLQLKGNIVKNFFRGILEFKDTIFIATQYGIRIIIDNDVTYLNLDKNIHPEISTIAKDRFNNIWVGTVDGFIMQLKGNTLEPQYFVNARVDKLFFDNNNKLWIGTFYRGLYHIDKDSVYHYAKTTPFYNVSINDINQDYSNNIWISTYGKGLINFANNKFTLYTENEGFPTIFFKQIERLDKDNLILTTSGDGIISFNMENKTIKNHNNFLEGNKESNFDIVVAFDKDRNLIVWDEKNIYYNIDNLNDKIYDRLTFVGDRLINNNSFKYIITDSKKNLWLSNFNSVSIANLHQTIPKNKSPNVIINNLIVNDKYIDFRDLIYDTSHAYLNHPLKRTIKNVFRFTNLPIQPEFAQTSNTLEIFYTVNNITNANNIKYKYYLIGLDKQWGALSSETSVKYRNLEPGKYTFAVKAISQNETYSQPQYYTFTIVPKWYNTCWFKLATLLLFVAFVVYLIRLRTMKNRKYNEELKTAVDEKTKLLNDKQVMLLNTLKELEQTNTSLQNISFFNSRLIGILGHDMIIPLHYIKKVTEQIKMHKNKLSANTINESIEDVNYTSKFLLYQSESLLQWAKFQDTNFKPIKSIINLNKIINELAELHTPLLNEKKNTIQLNLLEDDTVFCDQVIIKIILHNLLLNANKFTNNGTITISVIACQPNLILKIRDTGVGIEKDTLLELKNLKFVNSKAGTNNEIGYGMGYSLIFYLLNSANAKIDFESVRNEYTEITIEM